VEDAAAARYRSYYGISIPQIPPNRFDFQISKPDRIANQRSYTISFLYEQTGNVPSDKASGSCH
jgi:hypothetical protein